MNILRYGLTALRSEQTNIEGVVGVETITYDLKQAGIGIFNRVSSNISSLPTYTEANAAPFNAYNETGGFPHPIITGNDISIASIKGTLKRNPDYLVIKATSVGLEATAKKSTRVDYTTGVPLPSARYDFVPNEKVILLDETFAKLLVSTTSFKYSASYSNNFTTDYAFAPDRKYYIFGIGSIFAVAPFNRTDYFVRRDNRTPEKCSPASGVLFKAIMEAAGSFREIPVLDCVADMQIIHGINTSENPETEISDNLFFVPADFEPNGVTGDRGSLSDKEIRNIGKNPIELRTRLKMSMIFLMVQDGKKDTTFNNNNTAFTVGNQDFQAALKKTVDLTEPEFINYRWKLYRIVVTHKNM